MHLINIASSQSRCDNVSMSKTLPPLGETAARGQRIYQERLKALLEPAFHGQFAVVNVHTGDYEVAPSHLQALKQARLVAHRKDGLYVHYSLADDSVAELLQAMRGVAERRLAEMDRLVKTYLGERESLESIGFAELASRVRAGEVVVVDVRPRAEYDAGHIAGAISIPHDEVERRLGELPRNKEVVAYCRGPYCVFADEAVAFLRARGYRARRLRQGLPDWRAAGMPVEG